MKNTSESIITDGQNVEMVGTSEALKSNIKADAKNMMDSETITPTIIENMKAKALSDLRAILQDLETTHAGITNGIATAIGAGTGAASSIMALSSLGTVSGLSAAGVTTGLAAAGAIVGGGMLVGIGILATPVAALGVLGYQLGNKRKKAFKAAAVAMAVKHIIEIQSRLIKHKEHFTEELTKIKTTLETLTSL